MSVQGPNIALIVLDSFRYDHLWQSVRGEPLCPHPGYVDCAAANLKEGQR